MPLDKPVRAEITVPGSKSITNRALILAALAEGETTSARRALERRHAGDGRGLQNWGFKSKSNPIPRNSAIASSPSMARRKNSIAGTAEKPLELFIGNAGTAARFLTALVCLGNGVYRLSGVPRMHERPQAALFRALRELGYRVDSANDKLPAIILGGGGTRSTASLNRKGEMGTR